MAYPIPRSSGFVSHRSLRINSHKILCLLIVSLTISETFCAISRSTSASFGLDLTATFEEWQTDHFSAAQLNAPNLSGENADPDGDGLSNEYEFLSELDPLASDE